MSTPIGWGASYVQVTPDSDLQILAEGKSPVLLVSSSADPKVGINYREALHWYDVNEGRRSLISRGHESGKWKLLSKIGRYRVSQEAQQHDQHELLNTARERMLSQFKDESVRHGFLKESEIGKISETQGQLEVEMLAQHYGLPTRLLDWSRSFHTALFFAYGGWSGSDLEDPCVWCLDSDKVRLGGVRVQQEKDHLTKLSFEEAEDYYRRSSDGIQIIHRNQSHNLRVRRQQGWFTFMNKALIPLEAYIQKYAHCFPDATLTKILLRAQDQQAAFQYLSDGDTTAATIRCDLDGVSIDAVNSILRFRFEKA